jgi:signal peptidase II
LRKRLTQLLVIALATAGLDQALKALAVYYLAAGPVEAIPGFFRLVLVYNRGAAFGSFSWAPHAPWIFTAITLIAICAALWLAVGPPGRRGSVQRCLGLIVGGAVGNLIDRIRIGRVVDFADLYLGPYHWPAFNAADAAITLGGAYLAWLLIRGRL